MYTPKQHMHASVLNNLDEELACAICPDLNTNPSVSAKFIIITDL